MVKFLNTTPLPLTIFGGGDLKTETGNSETGNNICGGDIKTETGNNICGGGLKTETGNFMGGLKTETGSSETGNNIWGGLKTETNNFAGSKNWNRQFFATFSKLQVKWNWQQYFGGV